MPARKTSVAKQAAAHGISYACAKYRLANGIPLDAPMQPNGNEKAWEVRREKALIERAKRIAWQKRERIRQEKREQRMARREATRARAMEAARQMQAQVEAKKRKQERDAWTTITAAPRHEWRNPFAAMAVR
jgi:hypothetical protein